MTSFYRAVRIKAGKITDAARHPQSVQMEKLQQDVKSLTSQLETSGIAYSMPDEVYNDSGERTNCRREAGHTKGNTKNQRKNMKRQQRKVLTTVINHLQSTLISAGIKPCVNSNKWETSKRINDRSGASETCLSEDECTTSSDERSDTSDESASFGSVRRSASDTKACTQDQAMGTPDATKACYSVSAVKNDDEDDRALEGMIILLRASPLGFRVLERASATAVPTSD
jgi:hypothetical protein